MFGFLGKKGEAAGDSWELDRELNGEFCPNWDTWAPNEGIVKVEDAVGL